MVVFPLLVYDLVLLCQICNVMFHDNYSSIFISIYIHRLNFGLVIIIVDII